jgi:hypothetical protein
MAQDAQGFILRGGDAYSQNFNHLMQTSGQASAFGYLFRYAIRGTSGDQKTDPGFKDTGWREQMEAYFGEDEARRIVNRYGASAESALWRGDVPNATPEAPPRVRPPKGKRIGR